MSLLPKSGPHCVGFWRVGKLGKCWVCGRRTNWAYLDIGWQHPDCDRYPTEKGDVVVTRGWMEGGTDE